MAGTKPEGLTKCPCGHEIHFKLKKPKYFSPTVATLICPECDSRFLMHTNVKRQPLPNPGDKAAMIKFITTKFEREYETRFELIRLSPKASAKARNPVRQVHSMIVEKVSKRDNGPKF